MTKTATIPRPTPEAVAGDMPTDAASAPPVQVPEHIVEIVSDSGEGAQKAGQTFGAVSAKMGNGVWTVEIIPAEIKPPARSPAGASGIRIRLSSRTRHQHGRRGRPGRGLQRAGPLRAHRQRRLQARHRRPAREQVGEDPVPEIREQYAKAVAEFRENGLVVHELPMEQACLEITPTPRRGKNMFVLGMLCWIYARDMDKAAGDRDHLPAQGREGHRSEPSAVRCRLRLRRGAAGPHCEIPPRPEEETAGSASS